MAGLDSASGLELDADSCPKGDRAERTAASATSFDFNPLERAYRPRMLRVLPDPTAGKKEDQQEEDKWQVTQV